MTRTSASAVLLVGLTMLGIARAAAAQAPLGVEGDRLTVSGVARFLVFVSYFDGVRRIPDSLGSTTTVDIDLQYFSDQGVSGIRVMPNWEHPNETLMDCNGGLRTLQRDKLAVLIDRAAARGLVVDVSFNREWVKDSNGNRCLTIPLYKAGIQATTTSLIGKTNVLFDLQNEWNTHGDGITASQLQDIKDTAVKAVDPSRLVTASTDSGYSATRGAGFVKTYGFDILSYHDSRDQHSDWAHNTDDLVGQLRDALAHPPAGVKPIYLQEPNRCGYDRDYYDCTEAHYETAVQNAKAAGAAAWTFHNDPFKDLDGTSPFYDLLGSGERTFLASLSAAVGTVLWGAGRGLQPFVSFFSP